MQDNSASYVRLCSTFSKSLIIKLVCSAIAAVVLACWDSVLFLGFVPFWCRVDLQDNQDRALVSRDIQSHIQNSSHFAARAMFLMCSNCPEAKNEAAFSQH